MTVEVLLTQLDPGLPEPGYANPGDAGVDLYARHEVVLDPGERCAVATGVALALPDGYGAFVTPRSGLARAHGLAMVNSPGVIDAGYRGEISLLVINHDPHQQVTLSRGDRIGQLIVVEIPRVRFVRVAELPGSTRGMGGFGSSGR